MTTSRRAASRPVTLDEVARVAGVSRATVSRVVNRVTSVDESMRQIVERAISTTGYFPNRAARSLVTRRAGSIALVLPERSRMLGDPFFVRVVRGVMSVLRPSGVHLVLMMAEGDEGGSDPAAGADPSDPAETADARTTKQVLTDLRQGRLDGVILIHTHHDDPLPHLLIDEHLPVVLSGRPENPMSISYVTVDQIAGGALVAEHLLGRGCRQIATITGPLDTPAGQDRLIGFRDVLRAHGRDNVVMAEGKFTWESGAAAMAQLLQEGPDVDGVFIASDLMANGALSVLRRHGRSVPEDVAIVGFDDSSAPLACDPPLTTVRQPVEDMAAEMTRLLLRQIERHDAPTAAVVFEPTLVIRRSA